MSFWVYLLRCADGSYYVGHTDHLEKRMAEHAMGTIPGYTLKRRPVTLAFAEDFCTREEALERERQIKGWRREKKEALIQSDWSEISRLAKGTHQPVPSTGSG
ncbi:MAG: GIY-YIG nuclease family protein [candidate division NC10 bacterium]|nr:GIY-YIG nuclease family protein [candidate division NC10 bacterium]